MFELSSAGLTELKKEMSRYETKESAVIPALYIAQRENQGWISKGVIHYLAKVMEIPESHINEVAEFYSMFNKQPVGKYHVQVCTTCSCALNGARELTDYILKELKTDLNSMTDDGRFTVSKVECLGSCGTAPMMRVNEDYHEGLTPESAMNILRSLK